MYKTSKMSLQMLSLEELNIFNIIKPDCQRAVDPDQINKIYEYQIRHFEKYNEFFFANPIIIGCISNTIGVSTNSCIEDKYYIIDGQHRISCIRRLSNNSKYPRITFPCSILYIDDENELDEKYMAINQNKPVPLPTNIEDWKNFTKYVEDYLVHFRAYYSPSDKPQSPNFNKDVLLKYINKNNIAQKLNCNYSIFIEEMKTLNNYYRETYSISLAPFFNSMKIEKCIKKQPDNPYMFGLFRHNEWIDFILYKIENKCEYETIEHTPTDYKRPKIKKHVKMEIWKKRNNAIDGVCYCCNESLSFQNMEAGHVVAHFKGGKTILSNLEPICGSCNGDMGIQDLESYKSELSMELSMESDNIT